MIPQRKVEELFQTARYIPTELNIDQVKLIIEDFVHQPPSKKWTDYFNPKSIIMILLTTALIIYGALPIDHPKDISISPLPTLQFEVLAASSDSMDISPPSPMLQNPPAINHIPVVERIAQNRLSTMVSRRPPIENLFLPINPGKSDNGQPKNPRLVQAPIQHAESPQPILDQPTIYGQWKGELSAQEFCINLTFKDKGSSWKGVWLHDICVNPTSLSKEVIDPRTTFTIDRKAGQLVCTGQPKSRKSKGNFEFVPNSSFQTYLKSQGFSMDEANIEGLSINGRYRQNGKGEPKYFQNPEDIIWFRFFLIDMNEDYLKLLSKYDIEPDSRQELWRLANSEVTKEYLKMILPSLKAVGKSQITIFDLSYLKQSAVTSAHLQELKDANYTNLTAQEIAMTAWLATPLDFSLLEAMKRAGYEKPSLIGLRRMTNEGVTTSLIDALREARFQDVKPDQVTNLQVLSVNHQYIREIGKLKIPGMTIDKLKEFSVHGLPSEFVRSIINRGFTEITASEYITLWISDATPGHLNHYQGFKAPKTLEEWDRLNTRISARTKTLSTFTKMTVADNLRVVIRKSSEHKVIIKAADNMLDKIETKIKNGTLRITAKPGFKSSHLYDVEVFVANLNGITTRGGGKTFTDTFFQDMNIKGGIYSFDYLLTLGRLK